MALETTTYIDGLVATNPVSGDPVSQADDHLRLLKSTIKATFPNVSGPVTATQSQLNAVLTSGTAVASTSGTFIDFTSIPSWVKKITFMFAGLSTNGTSLPILQIGDSGGIETTGYLSGCVAAQNGLVSSGANATTGFAMVGEVAAASVAHGIATLALMDASTNQWVFSVAGGLSHAVASFSGGGSKSLSATLDRIRLTTVGGVNAFDAGTINILYE